MRLPRLQGMSFRRRDSTNYSLDAQQGQSNHASPILPFAASAAFRSVVHEQRNACANQSDDGVFIRFEFPAVENDVEQQDGNEFA